MGALTGGDKLTQRLHDISARMTQPVELRVGFLEGDVAKIAFWQEFGTKSIPPRPFFRSMIKAHSKEWPKQIGGMLKASNYDPQKALGLLGAEIQGLLQESIKATNAPALSPITVMLRGMRAQPRYRDLRFGLMIAEAVRRVKAGLTDYGASRKPLIDTGHMWNSVDYEVNAP